MGLLLANRQFLYSLLHSTFGREPDEKLLELLSAESTGQSFALLSGEEGDVLAKTPAFLEKIREELSDPEWLEKVRDEYTRLFIGPDKLVAPPWESVYLSEDATLFQAVTLEVRETYRAFGLLPEAYPHVADDSLALELAFMSKLAERTLEDFHNGDQEGMARLLENQESFLKKHLLRWVPKFLDRMKKANPQLLYPQLSLVTDAFIKRDCDTLMELRGLV